MRSGSDPAQPSTRGLTLPLGSGSGLVSSSVLWGEFVPGLWEYVQPENEEVVVLEVIEKVPRNLEVKVPKGQVTNLAVLACLHGLEESNLMYWIFEFGEEEGLMRVRSTKCLTGSVLRLRALRRRSRGKEMCFRFTYRFLVSQQKRKKFAFYFEDQVNWEFKRCMVGLIWQNGIWVRKGKAWGEKLMATLPLWVGGF